MREPKHITPAQVRTLLERQAELWDVRTPREYAMGHIPGARNVPLGQLHTVVSARPPAAVPVIVYCRSGQRSAAAAQQLAEAGWCVYDMGSIHSWDGALI